MGVRVSLSGPRTKRSGRGMNLTGFISSKCRGKSLIYIMVESMTLPIAMTKGKSGFLHM